MKIIAIVGTPTKQAGFTTKTVELLEAALQKKTDVEFEYLYLDDLHLPGCQGYLTCIKFGEQQCPFSQDLAPVTAKMKNADAVIFASPVHCFNVSTLMKNFFDLYVYQMHRPSFFGKKALVIASAAGAGQKGILKYLRKTVTNWGFDVVGQLGSHAGLFSADKYRRKLIAAADKLADNLITAVRQNDAPAPGIEALINFRVWRSVVRRTREASPYDWNHWQESGWLDQNYYFPARVNPVSNALAAVIERLIDRAIRTAGVSPIT